MSCEIRSLSNIRDLKTIQNFLGFSLDENWLNSVYYSLSVCGEIIAFGHGSKIVILTSEWSQSKLLPYKISWKGFLENVRGIITSLVTFSIYESKVSCNVEWTCLAIGLSTGEVVFYSHSGEQLFSYKWHTEPVHNIKTQSTLEFYVEYTSCICVIQTHHLFQLIKSIRYLNSRLKTISGEKSVSQSSDATICKKLEYHRKILKVNDVVIVGKQSLCTFDYLLDHSLEKGFLSKFRSSPPQNSLVIAVGVKPYVGFYFVKEGWLHADIGDVAKALANKVMSSLPQWLYKSSSIPSAIEEPQNIASGEVMICRYGICDIQRQASNIWLSPDHSLAIVTDNLNRIILIDCFRGTALRVWKGYRDAQCSFVISKDKSKIESGIKRKALFLVIYAPRRACLEIWALHNGPKVAAFNVCKNGQLIYNNQTQRLLETNSNICKSKCSSTGMCLFFDPSDKTIREIYVPFHCVLSEVNSKAANDIHLLSKLKSCLREGNYEENTIYEIKQICLNLRTTEVKLQCLETLTKKKNISPENFLKAIQCLTHSENCEKYLFVRETELDVKRSRELLKAKLESYCKLTEFYISIKEPRKDTVNHNCVQKKLSLSENDCAIIESVLNLSQQNDNLFENHKLNMGFKDKLEKHEFSEFLKVFLIDEKYISLDLKKLNNFGFVGEIIFKRFIEKDDLQIFFENSEKSCICSEDFILLIFSYWLEKPFAYINREELFKEITKISFILQHICNLAGEKTKYEYNSVSSWWQNIREMLLESSSIFRSLIIAIICKNVSLQKYENTNCPENHIQEDDIWECVSQETAQWSLLIGKLEDMSVLYAVLSRPIKIKESAIPKIEYNHPDCSLKAILNGGKGIISDLVGKWLAYSGIQPQKLVNVLKNVDETSKAESNLVIKNLLNLRKHFPFSLEPGILLCQMTWEFMCYWTKNLSKLEYFRCGLQCLEAFYVEDSALKHGLCCMIWNAQIKIPLQATKNLFQKVGGLPKDKLCQQNIGISALIVTEFLELCLQFFKMFSICLSYNKRELKCEEILQNGQVSLAYLALQQNQGIKEIINLYIQLCKVLHIISFFSFKVQKPVTTLFDSITNQTFFVEINRELPYKLPPPDVLLKKQRLDFLYKAVAACVDLVREDLEQIYVREHVKFMEHIEELAILWEIDTVLIKSHQIIQLYANGWDKFAAGLLEEISDKQEIGLQLLEIAGQRLNKYTANSSAMFCQIASIGSLLLGYLDDLKRKSDGIEEIARNDNIKLEALTDLAAKSFVCLSSQESKYLHIAGQMYDACCLLKSVTVSL